MGRRRKRQTFAFPSLDQPDPSTQPIDVELDAEIDGEPSDSFKQAQKAIHEEAQQAKNAEDKKKIAAAVKQVPEIFTPEQVVWIFDAYVGVISFIFAFLLKSEFKVIFEELQLDADTKASFSKPLAKIASKWAPSSWAGMTAEIELVCGMGLWTVMSFGRAKMAIKKDQQRKEDEQREKQTRPHIAQRAEIPV